MKKILLIHTGGTFGMVPISPNTTLAPGKFENQIQHNVPEVNELAAIDVEVPFNLDSSNIGIEQWDILSSLIYQCHDEYDGFVIIHGTDTMVYTASALSFSLLNFNKPIVLTGSQRPLSMLRSDARSNLIDAIELATMDIPDVLIVFDQKILRGNRAKKVSITRYEAFVSPNFPPVGEIGLNIKLDQSLKRPQQGASIHLAGFDPAVGLLSVQPSMNPGFYFPVLDGGLKVIILQGFGAGNLPNLQPDWIPFIKEATGRGITVFIGSQSTHGETDLELYECGQNALQAGATGLRDMTLEAAYVKLMKILTLTDQRKKIIEKFKQNWAGEI